MEQRPQVDVVLPAHNEADSIEQMVDEIFAALSVWVEPRVIACEDGSTDDTRLRLQRLAERLPVLVVAGAERKGYARALLDGLHRAESEFVLVLDADGQCDPGDFPFLWRERHHADIVLGWRQRRADPLGRRVLSRSFGVVYSALFAPPVHDPSCPFALLRRSSLSPLLNEVGRLPYGFWWELVARAHVAGITVREVPVQHRPRRSGNTRVFTWMRMPRLASAHLMGLARLYFDTR